MPLLREPLNLLYFYMKKEGHFLGINLGNYHVYKNHHKN